MRAIQVALGWAMLLAPAVAAQEAPPPMAAELAAISERGRLLYEYDQAAWHATDSVQIANPKTVEGQLYIARKDNGKWQVVFRKLNQDRSRFEIIYEADEEATLREFAVHKKTEGHKEEGFFLHAARAIEAATKDFGATSRPYNVAVLPAGTEQFYIYLYPAQTQARVYPLGGDARYVMSADGMKILEKRQMHKTIIENQPAQHAKKVVAGYHTHVLGDLPEDTDVFHVLTQDPPVPEFVATAHFLYQVKTDGTIQMEKARKRKKQGVSAGLHGGTLRSSAVFFSASRTKTAITFPWFGSAIFFCALPLLRRKLRAHQVDGKVHPQEADMIPLRRRFVFFDGIPCDSFFRSTFRLTWRPAASALGYLTGLLIAGTFWNAGVPIACAQTGPNSDPNYVALRNITLGSEAVSVTNFDLKRDAGKFHLHSGTVCFVPPVNGKVTGAVFAGDGHFVLSPPTETERKSLKYLTKEDEFSEKFERLVLRFTDSTCDEFKKAGAAASGGCDTGLLKDSQSATRHKIKHNLEAELLAEVLSPEPRGVFVAFVHGKRYDDKELYQLDPNVNSNQVDFWTYDENKWGDWASFNFTEPHARGSVGRPLRIDHHQLDTTLEKNGALSGKATTTFVSERNGLRVVPFSLFHTLRVQSVTADGQPLSFIQEDKNDDADFAVILPKPLAAGEKFSVTTTYSGKDAVSNEGGGNYYPIARHNWYPNSVGSAFGEYASYDMTFRIPKGMKIAATGALVSEAHEGGEDVSVWKSETPQTVAGFSFGRFKVEEAKLTKPEIFIQSFANEESPNWVQSLQQRAQGPQLGQGVMGSHSEPQVALGTMSTTSLNKKALAEGELAEQLYSDYFGPSLFTHLELTQQTACNFGQSWPGLVWIPICYYFDNTVRHQLGMDWGDPGYWKVVTPHEVAHQWWGHTVGFSSGRDQWMSEGFADMSASLYLSMIEKDPKKFLTFWNDERELLLEKDAQGFRAIDVGPLTMGYRANNSRTGGGITRRLIYPKGAYVLHMIRMMMFDKQNGDKQFKEAMQDFVNTYRGKAATTEDFKAMVEKHMTPDMDAEGNHKMDWFFNEYVYGTQLPSYKLDYSFDAGADGTIVMSLDVAQSGVDEKFRMVVPVYLELDDGRIVFLGRMRVVGNTSSPAKVSLKGLKTKPRRAIINYSDDVLASPS